MALSTTACPLHRAQELLELMSELKGKQRVKLKTTTQRMGEGGRAGLPAPRFALPRQGSGQKQRRKELDILQEHCRSSEDTKTNFFASHTV